MGREVAKRHGLRQSSAAFKRASERQRVKPFQSLDFINAQVRDNQSSPRGRRTEGEKKRCNKSARGLAHSKTWRKLEWAARSRSVMDCGSPLPPLGVHPNDSALSPSKASILSTLRFATTNLPREGGGRRVKSKGAIKAPEDWRTPRPGGSSNGPRGREASWTAAVLCRL
jgi:hypothetical protein